MNATWMSHGRSTDAAQMQHTCSKLVNGKLHFLAVDKGKIIIPKNTEEDGEQEGEGDKTDTAVYFNPTQPSELGRSEWFAAVSGFTCLACDKLSFECGCWYTCRFCPDKLRGKAAVQAHIQTNHKDEL